MNAHNFHVITRQRSPGFRLIASAEGQRGAGRCFQNVALKQEPKSDQRTEYQAYLGKTYTSAAPSAVTPHVNSVPSSAEATADMGTDTLLRKRNDAKQ